MNECSSIRSLLVSVRINKYFLRIYYFWWWRNSLGFCKLCGCNLIFEQEIHCIGLQHEMKFFIWPLACSVSILISINIFRFLSWELLQWSNTHTHTYTYIHIFIQYFKQWCTIPFIITALFVSFFIIIHNQLYHFYWYIAFQCMIISLFIKLVYSWWTFRLYIFFYYHK